MPNLLDLPVSRRRSDGIDLLRGILAVWVILSHTQIWSTALGHPSALLDATIGHLTTLFQANGQTHPAVIGFIVLSGYCIHLGGFRRSGGSARAYAIRRFFRIWPVYALASIVGIAAFYASRSVNAPLAMAFTGTSGISFGCIAVKFTGISVIVPALHQCSFEGNAPLTTVMVEMWLYAAYAFAVFLLFRRGLGTIFLCAIGVMFALGVAYVSWNPETAGWWNNGSFPSFLAYWWIGAAFVSEGVARAARRLWPALVFAWAAIAALLLAGDVHAFSITQIQQVILALLFGIAITVIERKGAFGAAIGRAGYSLYAFHAPILALMLLLGTPWYFAILIAIASGFILHHAFEHPLDALGKRIAKRDSPPKDARPVYP